MKIFLYKDLSKVAFLGLWETINNSEFNCLEFEVIKQDAGSNHFVMTPKAWIRNTRAIWKNKKTALPAATEKAVDKPTP